MKISGRWTFEDCVTWKYLDKEAHIRLEGERHSWLLGAEFGSCRGDSWWEDGTGETETSHHSSR